MTDNTTGPNPANDDPTPREYTVTIKVTLTKEITSDRTKIDDDLDRMTARIKQLLAVETGYAVDFTDFYGEEK